MELALQSGLKYNNYLRMIQDITKLTEKLISIKSIPHNTKALEEILEVCAKELKDFTIEHFEDNGFKSILVYNTAKRPKKFTVILNGHLDIIPGKEHQYIPKIINNKLYGVAAMDMKSSVACFILLFKELAKKVHYPLAIQLVTDEEVGGFYGTKYQIDKGVKADFTIVGETTNFTIENQAKGVLWVKISSKGKAAHGAYPWKGNNALWNMHHFLSKLEKKFPLPKKKSWVTTVNLSRIETPNEAFNKIPDACTVWLDIRYIPQAKDTILKSIKNLLPKGFTMEIVMKEPAQFVTDNNPYIKHLQKLGKETIGKSIKLAQGQGSSDARHFTRVKCDAIEFGPHGGGMGTDEEWVDIASLEKYYQTLKKFLLTI